MSEKKKGTDMENLSKKQARRKRAQARCNHRWSGKTRRKNRHEAGAAIVSHAWFGNGRCQKCGKETPQ